MAVYKRDTAFNELFVKPIRGLYIDHSIGVDEFKEKNTSIMQNRWIDTRHSSAGEKIYELYNPEMNGEIIKESLQEWLCDNRHEVTQCIGIALRNHERTYAEWFKYMDDRSGPDELALYCLSRKHGVHTAVFNKSYVWTTLSEHTQRSDEEIMSLCGINLVFLDHTTYGIIKNIRAPNPRTDDINKIPPTPAQYQKKQRGKTMCRDNSQGRHPRKRSEDKNNTTHGSKLTTLSESRHATFGITAPATRSVRSSRQPIDYLTLNDGLDEDTPISPKRRKKNTYRPRSGPSATQQAVAQNQTVSQESHTATALPVVPILPAAPANTERTKLSGVPDEQGLPDLVIDHDNNPEYPTTTQEAEAASTEEELEAANTLLSLVEA